MLHSAGLPGSLVGLMEPALLQLSPARPGWGRCFWVFPQRRGRGDHLLPPPYTCTYSCTLSLQPLWPCTVRGTLDLPPLNFPCRAVGRHLSARKSHQGSSLQGCSIPHPVPGWRRGNLCLASPSPTGGHLLSFLPHREVNHPFFPLPSPLCLPHPCAFGLAFPSPVTTTTTVRPCFWVVCSCCLLSTFPGGKRKRLVGSGQTLWGCYSWSIHKHSSWGEGVGRGGQLLGTEVGASALECKEGPGRQLRELAPCGLFDVPPSMTTL